MGAGTCGAVHSKVKCTVRMRCGAMPLHAHTRVRQAYAHKCACASASTSTYAHAVTLTPPCIQIYTANRERTARKNQWKKVFPPLEVVRRDLGVRKSGTMAYAYDVPLEKVCT